jgi:peptide/nickel transport system substrate-binding protein
VAGSTYTYTRNANYWNKDAFPYDKVVLKPMTDTTARLNALRSNQVQGALGELKNVKEAEAAKLTANMTSVNWVGLLLMDRDGKLVPQMKDLRVRQAMNYAFDHEAILQSIDFGNGKRTTQIFSTVSPAYDPALDSKYAFDLDKAKQLMQEAGAADGFSITIPRAPGQDAYYTVTEQSLAKINIKVEWAQVPTSSIIPEILSGKYPVAFMTLGSQSAWQDIQKSVIEKAPWNPLHATDPELQNLLKAAQMAPVDGQPAAFSAVSAWLVDHAWFSPWYRVETPYFTDAKTKVTMDPYVVVPPIRNFKPAS